MKEQLISFETAKLAKKLGFRQHTGCLKLYRDGDGHLFDNIGPAYDIENYCSYAPTQSLLQKWLREEHDITIQIIAEGFDENTAETNWCYVVSRLPDQKTKKDYIKGNLGQDGDLFLRPEEIDSKDWYLDENKSYEEALEKALIKSLKYIKH